VGPMNPKFVVKLEVEGEQTILSFFCDSVINVLGCLSQLLQTRLESTDLLCFLHSSLSVALRHSSVSY